MTPWVRQVCSIISRQKVAAPFAAYGVTKCKDAFVWFRPYQRWIQPSRRSIFSLEINSAMPETILWPALVREFVNLLKKWCRGTELNRRRQPFQGCALPPELPRHELSFWR